MERCLASNGPVARFVCSSGSVCGGDGSNRRYVVGVGCVGHHSPLWGGSSWIVWFKIPLILRPVVVDSEKGRNAD